MENTCNTHLIIMESQGKWNPSTTRIPEDTWRSSLQGNVLFITFGTIQVEFYKEKTSTPRKRCEPSTTIKAPMPSQIKVRITYSSLALQSCENSSNLTFGGYSAGTTSMLSVRSSLFSMQISIRAYERCVAH